MYSIGTTVTIIATGARGTIVGVEIGDDGSYAYKVKYLHADGTVVREVFASVQFSV